MNMSKNEIYDSDDDTSVSGCFTWVVIFLIAIFIVAVGCGLVSSYKAYQPTENEYTVRASNFSPEEYFDMVSRYEAEEQEYTEPFYDEQWAADGGEFYGEFVLSAYCAGCCCNGEWEGMTATGAKPVPGVTVAVDPDVIPLGSVITVNGAEYIAQDVGGAVKGNKIDILMGSHEEAKRFGVKSGIVFVKE